MIVYILLAICYCFNVAVTGMAIATGDDDNKDKALNIMWAVLWPLFWVIMFCWVVGERIYWWIYWRNINKKKDATRSAD